jgi:hypothetical protein
LDVFAVKIAWLPFVAIAVIVVGCSPTAVGSPSPSSSASAIASPAQTSAAPARDVVAPAVLVVACDGIRTDVAIPRVRARPDGVHLRFTNSTGAQLMFSIDDASGLAILGEAIDGAGGETVETFGTGDYAVSCGGPVAPFAVVDPDGVYVPASLSCPVGGSGTSGSTDFGQGATGPRGPVLDVARDELRGLKSDDTVEHAGYPRSTGEQLVRVVRAGEVIALLTYAADGNGGWLNIETITCPDSDITVAVPD